MDEREARLVERQQRWELHAVQAGVERFRHHQSKAEDGGRLADTKPGMRMLTAIMENLVPAVEATRVEVQDAFKDKPNRWSPWWIPILSLRAEVLAYITVRTVMGADEVELRHQARRVGQRCETERQFALFREHEREREKQMEAEGHESPENVFKLMCYYASDLSPRTFKKWRAKSEDFDAEPWGEEVHYHLGLKLIHLMVEHGGGWFQVRVTHFRGHGGALKTHKILEMTPEARAFLGDQKELEEVNRPWLVPMLSPPVPWAGAR